jgi:hypothetical protein
MPVVEGFVLNHLHQAIQNKVSANCALEERIKELKTQVVQHQSIRTLRNLKSSVASVASVFGLEALIEKSRSGVSLSDASSDHLNLVQEWKTEAVVEDGTRQIREVFEHHSDDLLAIIRQGEEINQRIENNIIHTYDLIPECHKPTGVLLIDCRHDAYVSSFNRALIRIYTYHLRPNDKLEVSFAGKMELPAVPHQFMEWLRLIFSDKTVEHNPPAYCFQVRPSCESELPESFEDSYVQIINSQLESYLTGNIQQKEAF